MVLLLASLVMGCTQFAHRKRAIPPVGAADGVKFSFYAPTAMRVQLAGSWPENNWAQGDGASGVADIGLMSDDEKDGVWELVVPLGPGRYRYLFRVDENTWHLDPGNPEEVPGGPTGTASQIVVFLRDGSLEVR